MKKIVIVILLLATVACKNNQKTSDQHNNIALNDESVTNDINIDPFDISYDSISKGLPIFYNMFLTVEMSTLFQSVNAVFSEDLVNPIEKKSEYLTSSKMAMNLGVYAVDLSYTRSFDQLEYTRNYLQAMQDLATDLGIPEDYFLSAAARFEKNVANKDSLYKIANEVYFASDEYLKNNERQSAASLIVLGGWIEALHIGTNTIYKGGEDIELLDRLVEQQYSLEMLIDLLTSYKEDKIVEKYLSKLNELLVVYKNFKLDYDQVEVSIQDFKKIANIIKAIRTEIIS